MTIPDAEALARAVAAKVERLQEQLLAKVDFNLSGGVLQSRSGLLRRSIVADVETDDGVIAASIASVGVPYAAIQEFGGTTPPHDIVPVKAQALAFAGQGGGVLARIVHHPGSQIPPRPFLGSALEALRGEIAGGLKATVLAALGVV